MAAATNSTPPSAKLQSDLLVLLDNANSENSDVCFFVGRKKGQQEIIYAHAAILRARARHLMKFVLYAQQVEKSRPVPVPVEAKSFRQLLRFIYGGELPDFDGTAKKDVQDLILVADRFSCSHYLYCTCACKQFKLAAETKLISYDIDTKNVSDLLFFAYYTDCARLKKVTIKYTVTHFEAVMRMPNYTRVRYHAAIMDDLMRAALLHVPVNVGDKKRPKLSDIGGDSKPRSNNDGKRRRVKLSPVKTVNGEIKALEALGRKAANVNEELLKLEEELKE